MIKAICFDFFNTLSYYHPSREQVYIDVCKKYHINIKPSLLAQSLAKADLFWRDENRHLPLDKRNKLQQFVFYIEYFSRAINGTGTKINKFIAGDILLNMKRIKWEFKLYEDTIPTLKELKDKGYILGLISNIDKEVEKAYASLGFIQYLDFNVTSLEAGCEKPASGIFKLALNKANVKPEESVYIGDQYLIDIVGARNAGMNAILLDRNNWFDELTDCPRIQSLKQLSLYI